MSKRIGDWLGTAVIVALVFFIADGWRQARETNRFIEQILEQVRQGDE